MTYSKRFTDDSDTKLVTNELPTYNCNEKVHKPEPISCHGHGLINLDNF